MRSAAALTGDARRVLVLRPPCASRATPRTGPRGDRVTSAGYAPSIVVTVVAMLPIRPSRQIGSIPPSRGWPNPGVVRTVVVTPSLLDDSNGTGQRTDSRTRAPAAARSDRGAQGKC